MTDQAKMPDVIKYLLGEAPLEGHWFGEDRPPDGRPFWWRDQLRQLFKADLAPSGKFMGMSYAPCSKCGYNGAGYYQPDTHPCASQPTPAPEGE